MPHVAGTSSLWGRNLEGGAGKATALPCCSGDVRDRGSRARAERLVERPVLPDAVDQALAEPHDAVARHARGVDAKPVVKLLEVVLVGVDRRLAPVEHGLSKPPVLLLLDPPPERLCPSCVHGR